MSFSFLLWREAVLDLKKIRRRTPASHDDKVAASCTCHSRCLSPVHDSEPMEPKSTPWFSTGGSAQHMVAGNSEVPREALPHSIKTSA